MEHFYDEFSKSLAASVPRRESLRRMGAVFAGAVLTHDGAIKHEATRKSVEG